MEINTAESTLIMDPNYQPIKRGRTPASTYTYREQKVHSPQQIVLLRGQGNSQQVRQISQYSHQVQQIPKIQSQQVVTNRGIMIIPQTTAYTLVQPDEAIRQRCVILERQNQEIQLELMKLRTNQAQEKITYIEDSSRCAQLENQIENQQTELQRLVTIIRDNEIEIDQWRQRTALLQQQLNNKEMMQQDTERMKKIYNENEQFFQIEIQRLNQTLQITNQQNQSMQQALLQQKQIENRYNQQIQESQFLTTEIENLNSLFKNKTDEFTQLKLKFQIQIEDSEQKNQQLQHQIRQLQIEWEERYQNEVRQRKEEVSRLSQANNALQLAFQDTSKLQEYETRLKFQTEEISRLNLQLKQKSEEIERIRSSNQKANEQLSYQYTENERKYQTVVQENDRISSTLRAKSEENEQLRSFITTLQLTIDNQKTHELENKIALLSSEIERLHQTLKCRSDELVQSRNQIGQLQNECNQLSIMNGDNQRLNNQIRTKNEEIEKLQLKFTQVQKETSSKQEKMNILLCEVETLTKQLRSKNEEIERTKQQIQNLQEANKRDTDLKMTSYTNEIERLNNLLKVKIAEIEQQKISYSKIETTTLSIKLEYENKIKEQQQRFLLVSVENERLTGVLKLQVEEIKKLERYQFSEQEKFQLHEKIKNLCQELDSWKQQFIILNREYHKTQENLILIQAELDSFKNKRNSTANFNTENFETFSYRNCQIEQKGEQRQSNYQTGVLQNRNF